jgi:hypothetical protein
MSTNDIDELRQAFRPGRGRVSADGTVRQAAVLASQAALKAAAKARNKYQRALGQQAEVPGADA